MTITIDDILHTLVSQSAAPSSMGAQLERLRYGASIAPDPFRARDEVESRLLRDAALFRCAADFAARQELRGNNAAAYKALEKVYRGSTTKPPQGTIALRVLRAYQERCTQSQERALVEVYSYLASIAPDVLPPPPKDDGVDLVTAFRTGKAKRARSMAAEVYADALLSLGAFLSIWNRNQKVRLVT